MSRADDAANAWREEEERESVDAAYEQQRYRKRADQVDESTASDNDRMNPEEAAAWAKDAWRMLDWAAVKFAGPEYALTEEDKATLLPVSGRMAQKHVPKSLSLAGLEDLIPVELVFLATVGWVYLPKRNAAQEAKKKAAAAKAAAAGGQQPGQPEEKEVKGTVTERRGLSAVP